MEAVIAKNLEAVRSEIAEAERVSRRASGSVELIAVSKSHSVEVIQEAIEAGQIVFGENKVQEAKAKIPELPTKLRWHMIGHLQSNKVRQALPLFEMIHGVDSLDLLRDLGRVSSEFGNFSRILLQVNVAGEASKFGFSPQKLLEQLDEIAQVDRIQLEGLMTIPPLTRTPEQARPYFVRLRELRARLEQEFQFPL
ncbi:MAG TPA: YggS family pyridoxal phosphate-dependent enzyme, partial [Chthoniobacterales bacterium]